MFSRTSKELQDLTDSKDVLIQRGHRLQARHKIGKLLSRISDAVLARHAGHELLLGRELAGSVSGAERAYCLSLILNNSRVAETCRQYLQQVADDLRRKFRFTSEKVKHQIPASSSIYEVLSLRLDMLNLFESMENISSVLGACGLEAYSPDQADKIRIGSLARHRPSRLRRQMYSMMHRDVGSAGSHFRVRHLLSEARKLDLVASRMARSLGIDPRIAMLSFSNFGSVDHPFARKVRQATAIAKERAPELVIDGEMQLATALNEGLRHEHFPFSDLDRDANILIFPDLQSGNLALHLLEKVGTAVPISPIPMGTRLPAHLLQYGITVAEVVNLATIGIVEAAAQKTSA